MMYFWTSRRTLGTSILAFACLSSPALAQRGGGGSTSGAPSNSSSGTPGNVGRGTLNTPTNPYPNNSPIGGETSRPIFLQGRVVFDDGAPANPNIRIERVCSGMPHLETHTDTKGRFYFQVGQNSLVDTDASDSSSGLGMPGRDPTQASSMSGRGLSSTRFDPLFNCDLRAAYPGYRSDEISLAQHRSLDDPEVGTIVLHRLAGVKGSTISLTTALAPKHAQKEYDKATQLAQKGKFDDAEKHLIGATTTYPKYAIAWFELGQVEQRENKIADARKSYEAAIAADNHYVSPYDQLAFLAAQESKWDDALSYSKQTISLNPVEFPSSYWYNALSNYYLKKPAEAEKSARELLKLDTAHHYPQAESLLAQILLERGERTEAAEHMRAYLALAPNASNAGQVRELLANLQQSAPAAQHPK